MHRKEKDGSNNPVIRKILVSTYTISLKDGTPQKDGKLADALPSMIEFEFKKEILSAPFNIFESPLNSSTSGWTDFHLIQMSEQVYFLDQIYKISLTFPGRYHPDFMIAITRSKSEVEEHHVTKRLLKKDKIDVVKYDEESVQVVCTIGGKPLHEFLAEYKDKIPNVSEFLSIYENLGHSWTRQQTVQPVVGLTL